MRYVKNPDPIADGLVLGLDALILYGHIITRKWEPFLRQVPLCISASAMSFIMLFFKAAKVGIINSEFRMMNSELWTSFLKPETTKKLDGGLENHVEGKCILD